MAGHPFSSPSYIPAPVNRDAPDASKASAHVPAKSMHTRRSVLQRLGTVCMAGAASAGLPAVLTHNMRGASLPHPGSTDESLVFLDGWLLKKTDIEFRYAF